MRRANERGIERGITIAFTGGTSMLMGYANERWGKAPVNDPGGLKELVVLGLPVDMLGGGAVLAGVLLGAFGKYDHAAMSAGNGALAAFGYRFGTEFARKHEAKQTATAGALGPGAGSWAPGHNPYAAGAQGRAVHFEYAPAYGG